MVYQNEQLTNSFPIPIPRKRIGLNYFHDILKYFRNGKKLLDNLPNISDALKIVEKTDENIESSIIL